MTQIRCDTTHLATPLLLLSPGGLPSGFYVIWTPKSRRLGAQTVEKTIELV